MVAQNSNGRGRSGSADECTRILLIEDHAILREGLRALLDLETDITVVGEAATAAEGRALAVQLKPDLVITDLALPDQSGLTIIPTIKEVSAETHVIVLTAHFADEYVKAALEAGADGYILKDATRSELIEGIRTVLQGTRFFSKAVASRVLSGYLGRDSAGSEGEHPCLTDREKEVLKLIAMANTSKQIASMLRVSVKTVEKHRSNLMQKLNLHNTAAVTLYAVRNRLVPVDLTDDGPGKLLPQRFLSDDA